MSFVRVLQNLSLTLCKAPAIFDIPVLIGSVKPPMAPHIRLLVGRCLGLLVCLSQFLKGREDG